MARDVATAANSASAMSSSSPRVAFGRLVRDGAGTSGESATFYLSVITESAQLRSTLDSMRRSGRVPNRLKMRRSRRLHACVGRHGVQVRPEGLPNQFRTQRCRFAPTIIERARSSSIQLEDPQRPSMSRYRKCEYCANAHAEGLGRE